MEKLFDTAGSNGFGMRFSTNSFRFIEQEIVDIMKVVGDYSINGSTISEMRVSEAAGVYHGMSTGEGLDYMIEVEQANSKLVALIFLSDSYTDFGDESMTFHIGGNAICWFYFLAKVRNI